MTIEKRFNKHISDSKRKIRKMVISKSIKKYGKENFKIEQIDVAYNQEQLNLLEGVYISWFNSLVPNGYNVTNIISGKGKLSKETKEKIKKKANDPNQIAKITNLGKNNRCKPYKDTSSKYCGVYLSYGKWVARYRLNNNLINLGTFLIEEDAAKAKDIAEIKLNKNTILNFPKLREQYLKGEIIVNKCKRNKIYSNIKGVSFRKERNTWIYNKKGVRKSFKTKEEAENYAIIMLVD